MTLRTRLLLGYGTLVALLLLMAGSAAQGFYSLGKGIDRILQENFESVAGSMDLLHAIERQDSHTLAQLLEPGLSPAELEQAEADFELGLARVRNNITLDNERETIEQLEVLYTQYRSSRAGLLAARPERPLRAYSEGLFPVFEKLKKQVLDLLEINQRAMFDADRQARRSALYNGVWLGTLVLVALLSMVFFSRWLQRRLLSRLGEMRQAMDELASGEVHRRIQDPGRDELALVAQRFNAALDAQEVIQRQMQGRLNEKRQLLLGLAASLERPLALLGLDGRLVVSTLAPADEDWLGEVRTWIAGPGRAHLLAYRPGTPTPAVEVAVGLAKPLLLRLVVAAGHRPVGWLMQLGPGAQAG